MSSATVTRKRGREGEAEGGGGGDDDAVDDDQDPWTLVVKEFEENDDLPWHALDPRGAWEADTDLMATLAKWYEKPTRNDDEFEYRGQTQSAWLDIKRFTDDGDLLFELATHYSLDEDDDLPLSRDTLAAYPVVAMAAIEYIQFHPGLRGGGRGSRLLQWLERRLCEQPVPDPGKNLPLDVILTALHMHRPFFLLIANRHGWHIVRSDRESQNDPRFVMHDDDPGAIPISKYDFSPVIGVYPPPTHEFMLHHGLWTLPSARISDLLWRGAHERRGGEDEEATVDRGFLHSLHVFQESYTNASVGTRSESEDGAVALEYIETTDPSIATHLARLDPSAASRPTVVIQPKSALASDRMPWYIALLVQLGRIYWRPVVIAGFPPFLHSIAWHSTPALRVRRHLGPEPAWTPVSDNGTVQWVPIKRARCDHPHLSLYTSSVMPVDIHGP